MSTALAPRRTDPQAPAKQALRAAIDRAAPLLQAVARHAVTPDQLFAFVLLAANKEPKLLECTPESIVQGLVRIEQWGLQLGVTAHLLAFRAKGPDGQYRMTCEAVKDYKGLIQNVKESGEVRDVYAEAVYAADHFHVRYGDDPRLEHEPNPFGDRGALVGFYAVAILKHGRATFTAMSVDEVNAVRDRKKRDDRPVTGPWQSDYVEMGRKTVVRRLCKRLPQSAAVRRAAAEDDAPLELPAGIAAPTLPPADRPFDMAVALGHERPRALVAPRDYYEPDAAADAEYARAEPYRGPPAPPTSVVTRTPAGRDVPYDLGDAPEAEEQPAAPAELPLAGGRQLRNTARRVDVPKGGRVADALPTREGRASRAPSDDEAWELEQRRQAEMDAEGGDGEGA